MFTYPKRCAKRGNVSTRFWKTLEVKDLVKYSAYAECGIIHFVNCEIFCFAKCEIKFVPSHAAGNFTRVSVFHSCRRNEFHCKKHLLAQVLFAGWDSWIRTNECSSQSAVSYRLTISQYLRALRVYHIPRPLSRWFLSFRPRFLYSISSESHRFYIIYLNFTQ